MVGGVIGLGSLVALTVLIVLAVISCTTNKHRGMYCVYTSPTDRQCVVKQTGRDLVTLCDFTD